MGRIKEYFDRLKETYKDKVVLEESHYDEKTLNMVPEVMRDFYRAYKEAYLPFGHIYTIEDSIKDSKAEPFKTEKWFSFGFDGYFSFWICSLKPDKKGNSFTYWDHESGLEIDGAVYKDIIDFLEGMKSAFENSEWE